MCTGRSYATVHITIPIYPMNITTTPSKACTKCGEVKPATREFFGSTPKGNLRGSCRVCGRKVSKQYDKNNPDSVLRRAVTRQKRCDGWKPSAALKQRLFQEQDGCCALCLEPMVEAEILNSDCLQVEHLTPVSRGGSHDEDNLVLSHRGCNQEKAAKTVPELVEWRARVGYEPIDFVSPKIIQLL